MNPNFIPLDAISSQPFDLDSIQIATPCRADWNLMSGDDRSRYCRACAKNVYNFSALTRAEAVRLIEEKEGHLCVQLHRRADGTLITADCTVGISTRKTPRRALQNLLSAVLAAVLGAFGLVNASAAPKNQGPTLGAPMVPKKVATGQPTRGKIERGEPVMGEAMIMSRMAMPAVSPPKTAPTSAKSHAKHSDKSVAAKSKSALQHRRHR